MNGHDGHSGAYYTRSGKLRRQRVTKPISIGVRAIDSLLTCGEGQRIGLFAAAGVGKSTLLGMIARNTAAEVNVITLVGERGREVRDFLEQDLGPEGLKRSVVVCATSDQAPLLRLKAAHSATAIAEHFRDRGQRVLLLLASLTRVARAATYNEWDEKRKVACVDALRAFHDRVDLASFGALQMTVGQNVQPYLPIAGVTVSVRPEIIVRGNGRRGTPFIGAIKLSFPKTHPLDDESGAYIATTVHQFVDLHLSSDAARISALVSH